ncbi:hypothetical protein DL546_006253 [Coniochaeta pulveracea]|uniref:Mid2 domain-containing protein n=1 Tax=Coniochaeta pulveracea TaxID=177199 RepID=A0A420YA57_9PEZI|nr:hypothetical protein DL546_006253 [Coniochaeta pulveracea]
MAPFPALSRASLEQFAERAILEPTKTIITEAILKRQTTTGPVATVTVTQAASGGGTTSDTNSKDDSSSHLDGGSIAGIVIGSIVGILLLIWIFRSCSNMGAPPVKGDNPSGGAWYDGVQASPYPTQPSGRRSHSRHSHHRHRSSSRRPSMQEYAVPVAVAQPQPTYVYQTDTRDVRRGRSRDHRSRSRSRY